MNSPWARIVNSTIKKYIRDREINVLRSRKLSALLKKKGRFSFNWSGISMDWKIKYKRVPLTPFADGDTLDFARKNRNQTAALDWRGYSVTDSMTKGEFLQNRNTEAIINLYGTLAEDLMDDCEELFGEEFYINGYLSSNFKRIYGFDSFTTYSGSNANGNGALTPSATYAGLSCVPGFYGGNWTAPNGLSWPNGKGDTQYDFWAPILVDVGDTLFSTTNTWLANCKEAISFGIIKSKKSKSLKGMLDVIFLTDEMYRRYISVYRTAERIMVERQADKSPLIALGFGDVTNQDGVDITWEYGSPGGAGYGFNIDMMELRSQQAQVFVPEGPDLDIATKSWRFSVDFYGNAVFNPKYFVKFLNATNSSDTF